MRKKYTNNPIPAATTIHINLSMNRPVLTRHRIVTLRHLNVALSYPF